MSYRIGHRHGIANEPFCHHRQGKPYNSPHAKLAYKRGYEAGQKVFNYKKRIMDTFIENRFMGVK